MKSASSLTSALFFCISLLSAFHSATVIFGALPSLFAAYAAKQACDRSRLALWRRINSSTSDPNWLRWRWDQLLVIWRIWKRICAYWTDILVRCLDNRLISYNFLSIGLLRQFFPLLHLGCLSRCTLRTLTILQVLLPLLFLVNRSLFGSGVTRNSF